MLHTLPRTLALSLGLAALCFATAGSAQQTTTPSAAAAGGHAAVSPADIVVGSGNYSPMVQDLDKAIEFYSLLGLTIPPAATPGPRPVSTDPGPPSSIGARKSKAMPASSSASRFGRTARPKASSE